MIAFTCLSIIYFVTVRRLWRHKSSTLFAYCVRVGTCSDVKQIEGHNLTKGLQAWLHISGEQAGAAFLRHHKSVFSMQNFIPTNQLSF